MNGQPTVAPFTWRERELMRTPATWVFVLLLVVGAWRIGRMFWAPTMAYPIATVVSIVLFTVYAVPFLIFITNVDFLEPEPKPLLAAAFGWGGLVAVATAVPGNAAVESLLSKVTSPAFAAQWGAALAAPTIEEPVKFLGIVMIALIAWKQINSVVDGIVYGAVVGLGFQVVEDVQYAVNTVQAESSGDRLQPVLTTFIARGFVSGLWSHTVFTAFAGAGVAYAVLPPHRAVPRRVGVAALGLASAWLCHFTWNSPLLTDGLSQLAELTAKGIPPLVLALALTQAAGNWEGAYYIERLQMVGDDAIASQDDLTDLRSRGGRAAASHRARQQVGWAWWRLWRAGRAWRATIGVRRVQRALAVLAVALSRSHDDLTDADVVAALGDLMAAKRRLAAIMATDGSHDHRKTVPPR